MTQQVDNSHFLSQIHAWIKAEYFVLILFAALTLVITYPAITQLNSHIIQNPDWGTDAFHHTYVLWWFKQAIFNIKTNPANLAWIQYPGGGYYPMLNTFAAVYLPGVPLLFMLSPVTVYNLLILMTLFLSGVFGYALCMHLTYNRWASVLGGIVYAFFPNHMSHAYSGHLELSSIYLFPLYFLLMIKTFHQPTWRNAMYCALALAISLLIQPMFIPFLLIPATLLWLTWESIGTLPNRQTVTKLGAAFGLAILLVLPFFIPVLHQQFKGQSTYLQEKGVIAFSSDLLGIISPSPLNPLLNLLGLVPDYARHAVPTDFRISELLNYIGIIPLVLGGLACVTQCRKVVPWGLLALGASILAMGPVLKVSGDLFTFTADDVNSTVALPYALIMKLPFLSYNRAPARLNITLMLAMSVLTSFGTAWLLEHFHKQRQSIIAALLCAAALTEFLVLWPGKTTPVLTPSGFTKLATTPDRAAVLNLPLTNWRTRELSLYYQTVHQHPIFDGWVQRNLPGNHRPDKYLNGLLRPLPKRDIIPRASPSSRAAIAQSEDVGYVALFKPYVEAPAAYMGLFNQIFGPALANDANVALYQVPPVPQILDELTYIFPDERWGKVETWYGRPARWIPEFAEFYLYAQHPQQGTLRFRALPLNSPESLEITVNGERLPNLLIGDLISYTTSLFTLQTGANHILFRSAQGCQVVSGDPRCATPARAAGSECNPYIYWERCLSLLFQDIRFVPADTGPGAYPIHVILEDNLELLSYDLHGEAAPGQPLKVTLYWQPHAPLSQDYIIFLHLLDAEGNLITQFDAPPLNRLYPTSAWKPEEIFTYVAELNIPEQAPSGDYTLLAGMYSYPDLERVPVTTDRPYAEHGLVWLQTLALTERSE